MKVHFVIIDYFSGGSSGSGGYSGGSGSAGSSMADSKIKYPVVSLEVVESLLRRHVMGVVFKEIEVD